MVAAIRVLVVDDCRDSADALSLLLKLLRCDVRTAYNGMTALEEAKRFRPELLLLDLGMPDMDGFAVAKQLRQASELSRAVLVAHTGYCNYQKRAWEAGFNAYLLKPASLDCLQRIVDWTEKTMVANCGETGGQAKSDSTSSFLRLLRDSEFHFEQYRPAMKYRVHACLA